MNDLINQIINIVTILIIFSTITISSIRNADIFSPIKLYSIFNLFFYFDIFFGEYDFYIKIIYLIQSTLIFISLYFEPKIKPNSLKKISYTNLNTKKIIISVWLLSLLPILNQIILIQELGGIVASIGNIAYRVKYFEGRGYILILNSFIIVFNIIYFQAIIHKPKLKNTILYIIHFLILVGIGLLSGSRSFIIMTMAVLLISSNYTYKRTKPSTALITLSILISLVTILGTLRNTVSTHNDEVSVENFSLSEKSELSHFRYGLIPLEIITSSQVTSPQYGLTYLSLITNFVPRIIFPEKLTSGGVYFTKEYADNAWGGDSHLATGAVTEGIINFGFFYGSIIGILNILLFYLIGIYFYKKFHITRFNGKSFFLIIPYIYFSLLCSRFSYSEFSYLIFNYILTIIIPTTLVYLTYKLLNTKWKK